jgi:hypothetical protein
MRRHLVAFAIGVVILNAMSFTIDAMLTHGWYQWVLLVAALGGFYVSLRGLSSALKMSSRR